MHSTFNASPHVLTSYLENCPMRDLLSGESFIAIAFLTAAAILLIVTRDSLAAPRT